MSGSEIGPPKATVRVRLTIEISARGVWGHDCTVGQARSQGIDEVKNAIRRGLVIEGSTLEGQPKTAARIVGEPRVTMVVVDEVDHG